MNNLAIIPARGGSKRIPMKNIRDFHGRPVIACSIEAALNSGLFDEIMVSTDDARIAEVALKFGAEVPFMRSAKNSDDHATIADALTEVIREYEIAGRIFDHVCCLFPTAPLIRSQRITEGYERLISGYFDSVCAVVPFSYPVMRALEITDGNKLQMIRPEYNLVRSQDLKPVYHDAGSFVWVRKEALLREGTLLCENGGAIVLNEMEVQDIDSEEDWKLAELKYRLINQNAHC